MKSAGLFIAGFGAALLVLATWLLWMVPHYFSERLNARLLLWTLLPGIGISAVGYLLVWLGSRRRRAARAMR